MDELAFRVGDMIRVTQAPAGGWWEGELAGRVGWFPCNHVRPERDCDRSVNSTPILTHIFLAPCSSCCNVEPSQSRVNPSRVALHRLISLYSCTSSTPYHITNS